MSNRRFVMNQTLWFKVLSFLTRSAVIILIKIIYPFIYHNKAVGRKNLNGLKKAIIVSNHCMYFDCSLVASACAHKRIHFTTLERICCNNKIGFFLKLLGAIPVPCEHPFGTGIYVNKALQTGWFVHIYPEGILQDFNQNIVQFKNGAFLFSCLFNVPIVPAVLVLKSRGKIRRDGNPRLQVTVVIAPPIYPPVLSGSRMQRHAIIQNYSDKVHTIMQGIIDANYGDKNLYNGKKKHKI